MAHSCIKFYSKPDPYPLQLHYMGCKALVKNCWCIATLSNCRARKNVVYIIWLVSHFYDHTLFASSSENTTVPDKNADGRLKNLYISCPLPSQTLHKVCKHLLRRNYALHSCASCKTVDDIGSPDSFKWPSGTRSKIHLVVWSRPPSSGSSLFSCTYSSLMQLTSSFFKRRKLRPNATHNQDCRSEVLPVAASATFGSTGFYCCDLTL